MKAKFIFENIEFERGRDPKDVMGIGNAEIRKVPAELNKITEKVNFLKEIYPKLIRDFTDNGQKIRRASLEVLESAGANTHEFSIILWVVPPDFRIGAKSDRGVLLNRFKYQNKQTKFAKKLAKKYNFDYSYAGNVGDNFYFTKK